MKPSPPGVLVVTGPPGGMVMQPSGRIISEYYTMSGPNGSYCGALISDDQGATFRPSQDVLTGGGEGSIALAPNGSLILNSRGTNNTRYQSASTDEVRNCPSVLRLCYSYAIIKFVCQAKFVANA